MTGGANPCAAPHRRIDAGKTGGRAGGRVFQLMVFILGGFYKKMSDPGFMPENQAGPWFDDCRAAMLVRSIIAFESGNVKIFVKWMIFEKSLPIVSGGAVGGDLFSLMVLLRKWWWGFFEWRVMNHLWRWSFIDCLGR